MKSKLYSVYNVTKKTWWVKGYMKAEPCQPYLWYDKKKAEKHLERMEAFYGWTEDGDVVKIVTFKGTYES